MRSLWKLFGISRMSRTSNIVVPFRCAIPTTMLRQRRLRWLGHVRRMKDGRFLNNYSIMIPNCWKTQSWAFPEICANGY